MLLANIPIFSIGALRCTKNSLLNTKSNTRIKILIKGEEIFRSTKLRYTKL